MKISTKLNAAIITIMGGFIVSVGFLVWTAVNAQELYRIADTAHRAIRETNLAMRYTQNLLISRNPLEVVYENYIGQRERAQTAMERLAEHPEWHRLPDALAERAEGALNVWNSIGTDFDSAESGIERILAADLPGGLSVQGVTRLHLELRRLEHSDPTLIVEMGRVETRIDRAVASGADFIVGILGELVDTIALNAEAIMRQNLIVSLSVTLAAIIAGSLFLVVFTRRFTTRVQNLGSVMDRLADRDFTVSSQDKGKDDIGELGRNINRVIASTSGFFAAVQAAVVQADALQNDLGASTEEATSALNEITSNIENIRGQFHTLDGSISSSAENVGSIDESVRTLRDRIGRQADSMATVSSSIEEMNANVGSVANLAKERKRRADDLSETVQRGAEKITGTNDTIRSIAQAIDDMLEIIEIINSVSEQTHLLSMNAAIESAHAGDAGKGFAVVAEEIRKLAESTSENAARIDENLRDITDKIREALHSSDQSASAFDEIQKEMESLSSALAEISQSMQELASGSGEVLASSSEVTESTESISRDAKEMARRSDEIRGAMESAATVSAEVTNGVSEIQRGAHEILESMVVTNNTSNQNRERMQEVQQLLDTFHIFSTGTTSAEAGETEEPSVNTAAEEIAETDGSAVGGEDAQSAEKTETPEALDVGEHKAGEHRKSSAARDDLSEEVGITLRDADQGE